MFRQPGFVNFTGISNPAGAGAGGATTITALDNIDNLYGVYAACQLRTAYSSALFRLIRTSDSAELDVSPHTDGSGWPELAALQTWVSGTTAKVKTFYDQSGSGRHLSPATAGRPLLHLAYGRPVFDFDGVAHEIDATSVLSAWSQNRAAISVIAVRKHDTANPASDREFVRATDAAGTARLTAGNLSAINADGAQVRHANGDTIARTTGLPSNSAWAVQVVRAAFTDADILHHRAGTNDNNTATGQTAENSQNTASSNVRIGSAGGSAFLDGKLSVIALTTDKLTDQEVTDVTAALAPAIPPTFDLLSDGLIWGNNERTADLAVATGTNWTVLSPDGDSPTEADYTSHRYRHHTLIAVKHGIVWVAFSSSGTNEDGPGQMTMVMTTSSANPGTWTGPLQACPPQSNFSAAGASYAAGTHITYPRRFVDTGSALYLVIAVDLVFASNDLEGVALMACECKSDGTLGTLRRISSKTFATIDSKPDPGYDATLDALLSPTANIYGAWGGSSNGRTASAWTGFLLSGGNTYVEPVTLDLSGDGVTLVRYWRRLGSGDALKRFWRQISTNSGSSWSTIECSDIPNAPSAASGLRLSDGRFVFACNLIDSGTVRDPLAVMLFSTTGAPTSVKAVRQGLSDTPVYAGTAKSGGAAYPGMCEDSGYLWLSYSMQKESIGVTRIALTDL